jgi:hypothetical protein
VTIDAKTGRSCRKHSDSVAIKTGYLNDPETPLKANKYLHERFDAVVRARSPRCDGANAGGDWTGCYRLGA